MRPTRPDPVLEPRPRTDDRPAVRLRPRDDTWIERLIHIESVSTPAARRPVLLERDRLH
jgi:hypothetical protein